MIRNIVGEYVINSMLTTFLILCFVSTSYGVEPCVGFTKSLTAEEYSTIYHRAASFQAFDKEMEERNMRRIISAEWYENSGYVHEIWVTRSGMVQWLTVYRDMQKKKVCITSNPRSDVSQELNLDHRIGFMFHGKTNLQESGRVLSKRSRQFQLFAYCSPMQLSVDLFGGGAEKMGLTKESIQAAAESRLRAARLFDDKSVSPYALEISIGTGLDAYNIALNYRKALYDTSLGGRYKAVTWHGGSFGIHGGQPSNIVSYLSGHLDKFLVEYLRVNDEACEARRNHSSEK